MTYTKRWELKPKDGNRLDREVPRDVIKNNAESKGFQEIEKTKNDPICEPLDVVVSAGTFNSLEGKVSGNTPSYKVGHRSGKGIERVKENEKHHCANYTVRLGDLGALLKIVQDWIF